MTYEPLEAPNPYDKDIPERRRTERRGASMPAIEIAELSAQAGRILTEPEAQAYRRRMLAWSGVERRLKERRTMSHGMDH